MNYQQQDDELKTNLQLKETERQGISRQAGVSMLKAYVYDFAKRIAICTFVLGTVGGWLAMTLREATYYCNDYQLLNPHTTALIVGTGSAALGYGIALSIQMKAYRSWSKQKTKKKYHKSPELEGRILEGNVGRIYAVRKEKTIRANGASFTFTGKQLDKLYGWYRDGVDTIRRDTTGALPGFDKIGLKSEYSMCKDVLRKADCIDENNRWTPKGVTSVLIAPNPPSTPPPPPPPPVEKPQSNLEADGWGASQ